MTLNNFLVFLFLFANLSLLIQVINCGRTKCLDENEKNCDMIYNRCCSDLYCITDKYGDYFCDSGNNCIKYQGYSCNASAMRYCCYGLYCSTQTKTCVTCMVEGEYCYGIHNFPCCKGLHCAGRCIKKAEEVIKEMNCREAGQRTASPIYHRAITSFKFIGSGTPLYGPMLLNKLKQSIPGRSGSDNFEPSYNSVVCFGIPK